jgi:hypothetical protein
MTFKKGDIVNIKCEARPGPLDEVAITISSAVGVVSGFVKQPLIEKRGEESFVRGRIVKIDGDMVEVQIPGSFFTSARGVTSVPRDWADSNMEHV